MGVYEGILDTRSVSVTGRGHVARKNDFSSNIRRLNLYDMGLIDAQECDGTLGAWLVLVGSQSMF